MLRVNHIVGIGVGVWLAATAGSAETFYFNQITGNGGATLNPNQLSVEVTQGAGNTVDFLFKNNVGVQSSICDIYFENSSLLQEPLTILNQSSGVAFSTPANPGDLPAGNTVGFVTEGDLSADSDSPVQPNGINASSESLTVRVALEGTSTFAQVVAAIADASLRIGLHVQGYANGASESFVTPEAGELVLLAVGLAGALVGFRRLQSLRLADRQTIA